MGKLYFHSAFPALSGRRISVSALPSAKGKSVEKKTGRGAWSRTFNQPLVKGLPSAAVAKRERVAGSENGRKRSANGEVLK